VSSADTPVRGAGARGTAVAALVIAILAAATGLAVGRIWAAVAPHFAVLKVDGGLVYADPEPEQGIAAEGWFLIIGAATGILLAVGAWTIGRRWRGPTVLVALTAGCLAASWIGYLLGHRLGLSHLQELARAAPLNTRLQASLALRVTSMRLSQPWIPRLNGVLAGQALFACLAYLSFAGWSRYRSLRGPDPQEEHDYQPAQWRYPPGTGATAEGSDGYRLADRLDRPGAHRFTGTSVDG
jgi:hypothetical protein